MFESQVLLTKEASGGVSIFSPWFPRKGDNFRFCVDVADIQGLASLVATVFHKNTEDTGDGATTGSTNTASAVGRTADTEVKGLKELVRFQFTIRASVNGTIGWVNFRVLSPTWFDSLTTT